MYFEYFWPQKKLPLTSGGNLMKKSKVYQDGKTPKRYLPKNHKGTRLLRMEKIKTDYKRSE